MYALHTLHTLHTYTIRYIHTHITHTHTRTHTLRRCTHSSEHSSVERRSSLFRKTCLKGHTGRGVSGLAAGWEGQMG